MNSLFIEFSSTKKSPLKLFLNSLCYNTVIITKEEMIESDFENLKKIKRRVFLMKIFHNVRKSTTFCITHGFDVTH